ncbi:hypothetical protein OMK64_01650 [Cellulomonas fimi]|uniref:hypothetical protein n=1 Tax=Cellulomonas fimi TaxID=1708 RepID=UPI00234D1DBB|nr:hypothetical protein [Cellulomonas fimi]MDC7120236.1 hypothetical protein [Cellulomonas fimi]
MTRTPPTPADRIRLFIALHDEYRSMAEAFPVNQEQFTFGAPRDASDRWHRLVRAMSLRKFMFGKSDSVYVPKVLDAVAAELCDDEASAFALALKSLVDQQPPIVMYGSDQGDDRTAQELVVDVLYGAYMHGDYDRWLNYESMGRTFVEHSLWHWTAEAERVLDVVRINIDGWLSSGLLPAADGPTD